MKEVYEFLKEAGIYYLGTVENDQARVRPFGTIDLFEDKLYIQTGLVKDVAKQMMKNPNIEISAMVKGRWIRVCAKAILDENIEAQKHMLDAYPNLQKMYQVNDGNTAVFYLKDGCATISSFSEPTKVINF